MLRITTSDVGETVTLKLEGKLSGPWVEEFERCCDFAMKAYAKKGLVVDLSGVTFVDPPGKKLLCCIQSRGASLIGTGLVPKSLIEEIRPEDPCAKSVKLAAKSKSHRIAKLVWVLILSGLLAGHARAQGSTPLRLTLHDAVATALKGNPQVQIATLSFAESQEDKNIARSALLPQVGLEAYDRAVRLNLWAEFGSPFPGIREHAGPFQFFQGGANFTVPLLDLTLWRRWQASHQGMNASLAEQTTVHEQIVLLVVSQYLAGMRAQAAVNAAHSRVDLAQALYDQAQDLQKQGVGTGIDTLRANVELQNEKQRLLEAETQLKVALYGLGRLLNLDPHREIELADTPRFFETPEMDSNQALEQAYSNRPELKALAARQLVAEITRRGASESRLPTISFSGTAGQQGLSLPTAIPEYVYQVTVDVPLFTGGRIHAEIAKADLEIKKVEQEQADLKNQVALEVKTSEAQLEAARREVEVANLGVKLATEEVEQSRDRFRAGVADNIEVISAQDALARANDNQIAALYGYNQARADLSHAMGQIESLYSK
jgi:outer membrane protein TolC